MGDFKIGDIICGVKGNGYFFTNEKMIMAKIIDAYNFKGVDKINVLVLNHTDKARIGERYYRLNNSKKEFKLCEEKQKKYELHIVSDGITTNCVYKEDGKLVSRSNTKLHPKDEFDFGIGAKIAIGRCFLEVDNKKSDEVKKQRPTKGKELIGVEVENGQKFRVINVEPHRITERITEKVCLDEYIGKIGKFNNNFIFHENGYDSSATYEKDYMNAIDKENGRLRWRWDEVELIYD